MLKEFAPSLYTLEGPVVSYLGLPFPTRATIARLRDGTLWVWSPVSLTAEVESAVQELGPVSQIVSPNKAHFMSIQAWADRWPEAHVHLPPGLTKKYPEIRFDTELGDRPHAAWGDEIDQVVMRGSFFMEEVAFFHRATQTAILGDLVMRLEAHQARGAKGVLLRLVGAVGEGTTPREWPPTFIRRKEARAARDAMLRWQPERMIVAHGKCVQQDAKAVLSRALSWL